METNTMKRIQRLIVAALTMSLVFTGFALMPMASQLADSDSDYGVAYAASKKVKVTWNANGGKIGAKKTKAVSITKGKNVAKLQTAKRTGYTLKGWYTKKSGGKKITKKTKVTKKATFYAQWTVKKYTLKYDANGGKVTPASKKVAYKKSYGTLPTPTLSGHTFEGWFTAKTGGTKVSTTTKMPARNVTLYAHWKKSRVLTAEEKKLVGGWVSGTGWNGYWTTIDQFTQKYTDGGTIIMGRQFNEDGTYVNFLVTSDNWLYMTGNWSVSNGQIHFTKQMTLEQGESKPYADSDRSMYYKFETQSNEYCLVMDTLADFSSYWADYFFVKGE